MATRVKMRAVLWVALLVSLLTGCAVNPVTGKKELNLVSESWELQTGKQQYGPLRQAQGGDYVADPSIQVYVEEVGRRLAAVSDRKLPYEFRVLNDSTPNAWALPGGKIVVNRGLLTALKSEAELAAVLGHEIVHAAARHAAKGQQRGMLLQGALIATMVATHGKDYAKLAQLAGGVGAKLVQQKYSREAELEADHYGMVYMSRAGYDPQGAVELQRTFLRLFKDRRPGWLEGLFASHPPSDERLAKNIATAATLPRGGEVGAARYRRRMAHLFETQEAYAAYDKAKKALKQGDRRAALGLVEKAIRIEPQEARFFALKGDLLAKEGRVREAKRLFDRAARLNSGFFYPYLRRGQLELELHQPSAARRDLERSAELLPTANALTALGALAEAEGDLERARKYYRMAAKGEGEAGRKAYGALMGMDLARHPGRFIKMRTGIDRSGHLVAELSNPTPRDVTDVVILVRYPTRSGELREVRRRIEGRLPAGRKMRLELGRGFPAEAARQVYGGVIGARLAR